MADKLISEITDADIEAARRHIEDNLIEMRDLRSSTGLDWRVGHGLVVKERDGRPSDMIRLRTVEAIRMALRAIIEAPGLEGGADA